MKWPKNAIAHSETMGHPRLDHWDVTVVDDEAKCKIGCGENENKSKSRQYKIGFTARWGQLMKLSLLWFFEQNQLF